MFGRWKRTDIADSGAHLLLDGQDLVDDLVRLQVAGKAALAGRAERAPHGAADLRNSHTEWALSLQALCGALHASKDLCVSGLYRATL